MDESRRIVANKMRTPDGTILWSKHRHDYVTHKDANGKEYMLDGGTDYIRRSANGDEELMTVYSDALYNVIRQNIVWGTRGKDGTQPVQYKPLAELDTEHIQAILETQTHISAWLRDMFETELEYRTE